MRTYKMTGITLGLCGLGLVGCGAGTSGYDAEASREFRAAWEKRRTGDEAGYRTALAAVAKKRGTWAGDRAAMDLEMADDQTSDSTLARLMRQAAEIAGDPSKLPGGLPGGLAIPAPPVPPAGDEEQTPAPDEGDTKQ